MPDDQRSALVEEIQDLSRTGSFDGEAQAFSDLLLGNDYTDGLADLDAADSYADDIIEAAPGATFVCWTDPKHEWRDSLHSQGAAAAGALAT